jgi:hypothetical protein
MPISLGHTKVVISYDDMVKLIQLLNVELHLFDTKKFQDFAHKLIGLCVVSTLEDFLNHLDSTSLNYFANIVMSPNKTASGVATFLKGTEIEQNYKKIYGPSCRDGVPVVVPKVVPDAGPVWIHRAPDVHPGIPVGFPIFPKPGMVGGYPAPIGVHGINIGYGVVVGTPFGHALIRM